MGADVRFLMLLVTDACAVIGITALMDKQMYKCGKSALVL